VSLASNNFAVNDAGSIAGSPRPIVERKAWTETTNAHLYVSRLLVLAVFFIFYPHASLIALENGTFHISVHSFINGSLHAEDVQ
jgi:hypothetical protein